MTRKDKDFKHQMKPVNPISFGLSQLTKVTDYRLGHHVVCDNCGLKFQRPSSHVTRNKKTTCCSRECSSELRKKLNRTFVNCVTCGKEMWLTKDYVKKGIKTCSRECRSIRMRGPTPTKYDYKWKERKKENMKEHCDQCGGTYRLRYHDTDTVCIYCWNRKKISP